MPHQPYVNPITGQPFVPRLNIPEVFGKGLSYEDQIHMLLKVLNDWLEIIKDYPELTQKYEELLAEFEKFKESGFTDYYEEQIAQWVAANMDAILTDWVTFTLLPGLTEDGRFCVWYPRSWKLTQFSTGTSLEDGTFGRLIVKY